MNTRKIRAATLGLAAGLVVMAMSGAAQAALTDRGGGLIYDDVLNVTWLADANHAKTSGYDADGLMTWSQATTWALFRVISINNTKSDFNEKDCF